MTHGGVLAIFGVPRGQWSLLLASVVAAGIKADVLAVQETHLTSVTLERSQSASRQRHGLILHHGRPVALGG